MDAELKSKRNFEWIKVLAWGFIAIILFVTVIRQGKANITADRKSVV